MAKPPESTDLVRSRALADPSRRRVLDHLGSSPVPLPVRAIADATELHPNTVRDHLQILETAGFVGKSSETRQTRGRPRNLYHRIGIESPTEAYRRLAEVLLRAIASDDDVGPAAVRSAGAAWTTEQPAPPGDSAGPVDDITTHLAVHGFAPEPDSEDDSLIRLHACPFADLAAEHPEIVCTAHRGMLEGAVSGMDTIERATLQPFADGNICHVQVDRR